MSNKSAVELLVDQQVSAYNARDIDAFMATYAEDAKIISAASGEVVMDGHEGMRDRYKERFDNSPNLNASIENRIVLGPLVVDLEHVTGIGPDDSSIQSVVAYEVSGKLIKKAWFFDPPKS